MSEHICPRCGFTNPQGARFCNLCGGRLSGLAPTTTVLTTERSPIQRILLVAAVIGLFVWGVLIPMIMDGYNFSRGHTAYVQANCTDAAVYFRRVLSRERWLDPAKWEENAEKEHGQCLVYLLAVQTEQSGNLSDAAQQHIEFVDTYPTSAIVPAAKNQVNNLFHNQAPALLANKAMCDQVSLLRDWVTTDEEEADIWAPFYVQCISIFQENGMEEEAYTWFHALISLFPEHPSTASAVAQIMGRPAHVFCKYITDLRVDSTLRTHYPNAAPTLYLACGMQQEVEENSEAAYTLYRDFLTFFSDHSLYSRVVARILQNEVACDHTEDFEGQGAQPAADFLPDLYLACGKMFGKKELDENAYGMYMRLLTQYPGSEQARKGRWGLLGNATACEQHERIASSAIAEIYPDILPRLYYKCGQRYDEEGDAAGAYTMYYNFWLRYPNNLLMDKILPQLLRNEVACEKYASFEASDAHPAAAFLPDLYLSCGRMLDERGQSAQSLEMHSRLLIQFPDSELATEAEAALLTNPAACEQIETIADSPVAERPDLMPRLYSNCAQMARTQGDYEQALLFYDMLMRSYPHSTLAGDAKTEMGWTYIEWGASLVKKEKFTAAMEHYRSARQVTWDADVQQTAQQGYDEALWLLATSPDGEGWDILDDAYDLACAGRGLGSPAVALDKENPHRFLLCKGKSEYKLELPRGMVTAYPAHFYYVIQVESGESVIQRCPYKDIGCVYNCPTTNILVRIKRWVKVIIRSARTGAIVAQHRFEEIPEACPQTYSFSIFSYEEEKKAPWPDQEEILAWIRRWE